MRMCVIHTFLLNSTVLYSVYSMGFRLVKIVYPAIRFLTFFKAQRLVKLIKEVTKRWLELTGS